MHLQIYREKIDRYHQYKEEAYIKSREYMSVHLFRVDSYCVLLLISHLQSGTSET